MKTILTIGCLVVVASLAPTSLSAAESVLFGRDRIELPATFVMPTAEEQREMAKGWCVDALVRKNLGSEDCPLLDGFQCLSYQPGSSLSYHDIAALIGNRDKDIYIRRRWDSIGCCLKPIMNARQALWALQCLDERCLDQLWQDESLTADELRGILRAVDSGGSGLPLKTLKRDFDADSLAKRCFFSDGIWMAHFVSIEHASVVEYKYVINRSNHIGRLRRVLVEGPDWPPKPVDIKPSRAGCNGVAITGVSSVGWQPTAAEREIERCMVFLYYAAHAEDWQTLLGKPRAIVAYRIGDALCDSPKEAAKALPFLKKSLGDRDRHRRTQAVYVLANMGPAAKEAIPELRIALLDGDKELRGAAALVIRRLGPVAKAAIPELRVAMLDREREIKEPAALALLEFGPPDARVEAARILGGIPFGRGDARPELVTALSDEDLQVRQAAAEAIKKLRGEP